MPAPAIETILIVDDEPGVRSMCETVLTHHGYHTVSAADAEDALHLLSERQSLKVDVALLDLILPGMGGPELAEMVQRMRPGVSVLFMTGYPDQLASLIGDHRPVLKKPFTSVELINKIREVLDARKQREPPS